MKHRIIALVLALVFLLLAAAPAVAATKTTTSVARSFYSLAWSYAGAGNVEADRSNVWWGR